MTPLQAIRARRESIEHDLRESQRRLAEAQRTVARAADAHGKLAIKHREELKQLNAAERALGHSKPARKRAAKRSSQKSAAA